MTLQKHSELAKTSVYTFHDDSRHASVVLGPGFSLPQTIHDNAEATVHRLVDRLPQAMWHPTPSAFEMETVSPFSGARLWRVALEESASFPKRFRVVVGDMEGDAAYSYEVKDDFGVEYAPVDMMPLVPESVFGGVLGAAVGATEVKKLMLGRLQRQPVMEKPLAAADSPRSDWRAPRFSFTLRTATGSPFAERWGFAVQEAVAVKNGFRIWIEQQRTGREIYLRMRPDGSIEGIHELEQLPAAVHGAGLGMVLMFHHAGGRMEQLLRGVEQGVPQAVDGGIAEKPVFVLHSAAQGGD